MTTRPQHTPEEFEAKAKDFMRKARTGDSDATKGVCPSRDPSKVFPDDDEERAKYKVATFICDFFPDAIAELARFSYEMQAKHCPDQPMCWAKDKSIGDGNQIIRHLMDKEYVNVAWRGLELLQRKLKGMEPFNKENNEGN